ncbi:MAG: hypothetical protein ACI845_000304 [Gammaproteobacteria bacterium]|jgi:hypothetical protein
MLHQVLPNALQSDCFFKAGYFQALLNRAQTFQLIIAALYRLEQNIALSTNQLQLTLPGRRRIKARLTHLHNCRG